MTTIYAKISNDRSDTKKVVFVVCPNVVLLGLVGPLQALTHAKANNDSDPAYEISIVSISGGLIETNTILQIDSDALTGWLTDHQDTDIHTLIVIGGEGSIDAALNCSFIDQIKLLASRSTRVCSVCSGVLVLAAAGLLDGRRAVTHWAGCEYLSNRYPRIKVEKDPIFIKDGIYWTSAGITAGLDMALAIVAEDLGKTAAVELARLLVMPMVRSGGQSQFSSVLDMQKQDNEGRFADLHSWIAENLEARISVDDMAQRCGMSSRNFSRRYTEVTGSPPAKAVEAVRVDAARDLLSSTDKNMRTIAAECGFQDDERMRRAFLRTINTSPSRYRSLFNLPTSKAMET